MKIDSPLPETVRLIAKVLAARPTTQEEVPEIIAAIQKTVVGLTASPAEALPIAPTAAVPAEPPPRSPPRPRREPKPRLVIAVPEAEPAPPPAPRLMRRAEVAPSEPAAALERPTTKAALRGIVKWFDPRTRVGSVRLPGYDDVAIDRDAVDRAGLARLYKGQEIEASIVVDGPGAAPRLLAISLPGRPETETLPGGLAGGPRRNAKPVVIEMKRDAMRRVAARVEAEHLLGTPRRPE
jgi:cold shock CspA family protein